MKRQVLKGSMDLDPLSPYVPSENVRSAITTLEDIEEAVDSTLGAAALRDRIRQILKEAKL